MPALGACELLHDRYQVLRRIGRGGMGTVYEAVDLRLRNVVAVKQMTTCGTEAEAAFRREAMLLASLRHMALPVVIDFFVQDGSRFLVMQYIEGEDLEARLRRTGPCAEAEATRWAVAVLNALAYLHDHEPPIVHRDIKPSNIKLTPRGEVVLLDFGLAKGPVGREATQVEEDRSIFGFTPSYAPLEQLEARGTDARSDLYALAATLYHLVVGVAPPSAGDRAAAVIAGRPDPLMHNWPTSAVSHHFRAALVTALELDKERRYQSAHEMLAALTSGAPVEVGTRPAPSKTGLRRLDAAAPSQAEVGRPVDVIVQVRFADSPLLGLEEWPSRRRPAQIEQASEQVRVEHPEDPRTGRKLPARLRVALVAPDFEISGASEYVIDVPPDEYSKRLVFLLTPQRAGYCRVHVEVYTAVESVLLGTVPVETEAVTTAVQFAPVRATELVLGVMAAPPPALPPAFPLTAESAVESRQQFEQEARERAVHEARQQAERREEAERRRALQERAIEREAQQRLLARMEQERRDREELQQRALETQTRRQQEWEVREREWQEQVKASGRIRLGSVPPATDASLPARRSLPPPATGTAMPPPVVTAEAPGQVGPLASSHWRLPRWAYSAAAIAVLVTSVAVWQATKIREAPLPAPTTASPSTDPRPTPTPIPPDPPLASTDPSIVPSPAPGGAPLAVPEWQVGSRSWSSTTHPDVQLTLRDVVRRGNAVRIELEIANLSRSRSRVAFDAQETRIVDPVGRAYAVATSPSSRSAFNRFTFTQIGQRLTLAVDVSLSDQSTGPFELILAPAAGDRESVRFPRIAFKLPAR